MIDVSTEELPGRRCELAEALGGPMSSDRVMPGSGGRLCAGVRSVSVLCDGLLEISGFDDHALMVEQLMSASVDAGRAAPAASSPLVCGRGSVIPP